LPRVLLPLGLGDLRMCLSRRRQLRPSP
jgi:hypothetical protein